MGIHLSYDPEPCAIFALKVPSGSIALAFVIYIYLSSETYSFTVKCTKRILPLASNSTIGPQSSSNRTHIRLRAFIHLSPSLIAMACLSSFKLNGLLLHITHPKTLLASSRSRSVIFSLMRFKIRPYLDGSMNKRQLDMDLL